MKRLLKIIIPAILLLAGGGGAAYWFFFMSGDDVVVEVLQKKIEPGTYTFDPFVVPVIIHGQVTHHLTMYLTLELADKDHEPDVKAAELLVKDSILTELHGLYSLRQVREQGFDSPLVKQRLALASADVLDEVDVTGVALEIKAVRK